MDNAEILATLGTHYTGRSQKNKTKTKKMSNTESTNNQE